MINKIDLIYKLKDSVKSGMIAKYSEPGERGVIKTESKIKKVSKDCSSIILENGLKFNLDTLKGTAKIVLNMRLKRMLTNITEG